MKYKNYRNSKTKDNRIYTTGELKNMSLDEIFRLKEEILAQNRAIGVPSESELRGSSNVVYVHEYTREDGTQVKAHWRSKSGSNMENNKTEYTKEEKITQNSEKSDKNFKGSRDSQKFIKPVEGKITSDFGYRNIDLKGATKNHSGIDIAVPVGTSVKAIADGKVVAANGGMRGYGKGVFVDHGTINGKHVISEYGHLSQFEVKVGDRVIQGQELAKSGNTGTSTGPHLHLTIRENNIPIDPKKYIGNYDK